MLFDCWPELDSNDDERVTFDEFADFLDVSFVPPAKLRMLRGQVWYPLVLLFTFACFVRRIELGTGNAGRRHISCVGAGNVLGHARRGAGLLR
eukprot:SAG31_NODE_175_length_21352_cov_3.981508_8_plen_93_part_00